VLGHAFGPWRIDLASPAQKVAVEVDGWAWHVDPELSQPPDGDVAESSDRCTGRI
jgi:hypothetical protein